MSIDLNKMPKLGFGLMRLPEKDGVINLDEVCRMVDAYLDAGLTYFDTAYVYHGGNSEKIVKDALVKRHPRESFTLATKLPAWCMKEEADRDRIFNEQLERCGLDFFDFYLLCRSRFFPHYFPEVEQLLGPHLFGYNWKSHLFAGLVIPAACLLLARICTLF